MNVKRITEKIAMLVSCVALAFVLMGSAGLGVRSAKAAEKFIFAHAWSTEHIANATSLEFIEKLKEVSGGQLEVEFHPGGDLGDHLQQFEQVLQGSLPMSMVGLATDFDQRLNVGYLAYIVDNWQSGAKLYGPGGSVFNIIDEVLNDLDMKLLGTIPGGFGSIAIRKGVGKVPTMFPEDSKGIKMRVPTLQIGVKRFEAWGFSPVPMPYSELYTALQLGAIDGRTFGPPQEIWEMRDTIETYILTRDYLDALFWVVSKKWWDTRSPDEQKWITEAADYATRWSWEEGERLESVDLKRIRDYGIKVVELSADELAQAKKLVFENEWPWMEKTVGKDLISKIRKAVSAAQ